MSTLTKAFLVIALVIGGIFMFKSFSEKGPTIKEVEPALSDFIKSDIDADCPSGTQEMTVNRLSDIRVGDYVSSKNAYLIYAVYATQCGYGNDIQYFIHDFPNSPIAYMKKVSGVWKVIPQQ